MQYAHEYGCKWDISVILYATENGYLECLKYAHVNGCPWDERVSECAAKNGKLACLQYTHENGCPWDESVTRGAALLIKAVGNPKFYRKVRRMDYRTTGHDFILDIFK